MSVTATAAAVRLAARNLKKAEAEAAQAAQAAKGDTVETDAEKKAVKEAAKALKAEAAAEKKAATEAAKALKAEAKAAAEAAKAAAKAAAEAAKAEAAAEKKAEAAAKASAEAHAELVNTAQAYLDNLTFHPDFHPFPDEEAEAEATEDTRVVEVLDAKTRTNVLAHIAAGLELAKQDIPDIEQFPNIGELEYAMASVSHAKLLETFRSLTMKFSNSKPESYKRVFVAFVAATNARKLKLGEKAPAGPTNDELRAILRVSHVNQAPDKAGLVERIKMLINGFDKFLGV